MEASLPGDLPSTTAHQRPIYDQLERCVWCQEGTPEQISQQSAEHQGRPDSTVAHAMVGGEPALLAQSHGTQGRRHRAPPARQDRARHQTSAWRNVGAVNATANGVNNDSGGMLARRGGDIGCTCSESRCHTPGSGRAASRPTLKRAKVEGFDTAGEFRPAVSRVCRQLLLDQIDRGLDYFCRKWPRPRTAARIRQQYRK